MGRVKKPVYLDYQATTPVDPKVLAAMRPFYEEMFGNPHSQHRPGWEALAAVDVAREDIAGVIGASADEIIFTSGATEANNLVIKGIMQAHGREKPHMITVVSEHKCLLESARAVEGWGLQVTRLGVDAGGLIDLDELSRALTPETALVSVMAVNNEIGVIQPLAEIGAMAHRAGALFHSDAAQAFGKIPLDVEAMQIDLLSLSGHKIYGPKGVGAVYIRSKPHIRLVAQMSGGGQERGLRSGTLAPALAVGFGTAARLVRDHQDAETREIAALAEAFWQKVKAGCPGVIVNGSMTARYPGNLNISFPGLDGDLLLANLDDLALSSGAACASATAGPSYVLQAIGVPAEIAKSSLRIGFGRFTTTDEVEYAATRIIEAVSELGGIPDYFREGVG